MDVSSKRERAKPTGEGPHIQWDEEVIAEHDKLRGTRQKIEEPPTPYRYDDDDYDYEPDQSMNVDGCAAGETISGRSASIPLVSGPNTSSSLTSSSSGASRGIQSENVNFHRESHSPDSPAHQQSFAHSPSQTQVGDNVMDVWESLKAKLVYEQQKQSQGLPLRPGLGPVVQEYKSSSSLGESGSGSSSGSAGACVPMGIAASGHMADTGDTEGDTDGAAGDDSMVTVGFDREPAPATKQFKSHRAAHYNEFQLMKAMREKLQREQEEEEEEDDEE
jgi:hypothetical protein